MIFEFLDLEFCLFSRTAGVICVNGDDWSLHIYVRPKHWFWGYECSIAGRFIGFGPFFLWCSDF